MPVVLVEPVPASPAGRMPALLAGPFHSGLAICSPTLDADRGAVGRQLLVGAPHVEALYLSARKGFLFSFDGQQKTDQALACLFGRYTKASGYRDIANQQLMPIIPQRVVWVGIIQSVLCSVLLFLSGLALRNMFRMK